MFQEPQPGIGPRPGCPSGPGEPPHASNRQRRPHCVVRHGGVVVGGVRCGRLVGLRQADPRSSIMPRCKTWVNSIASISWIRRSLLRNWPMWRDTRLGYRQSIRNSRTVTSSSSGEPAFRILPPTSSSPMRRIKLCQQSSTPGLSRHTSSI